jgi:hypothetical protein
MNSRAVSAHPQPEHSEATSNLRRQELIPTPSSGPWRPGQGSLGKSRGDMSPDEGKHRLIPSNVPLARHIRRNE